MRYLITLVIVSLIAVPALAGTQLAADGSVSVVERTCGSSEMWLPPSSKAVMTEDGRLEIHVAEGWVYVGRTADGTVVQVVGADCSCDCTSSSGNCMPSIFNGNCSCTAKDGCTACSLTTGGVHTESMLQLDGEADAFSNAQAREPLQDGGYINLAAGVSFATPGSNNAPLAFSAMFELPKVKDAVTAFLAELYLDGAAPEVITDGVTFEAPQGYALAAVNVFGRTAVVVVPDTLPEAQTAPADGSCSCTDGTCTYDSSWTPKGTLHYCDGECAGTCTLTMQEALADGGDLSFSVDGSYR